MAARPTGPLSGYSTQARISLRVADLVNNGRIRFWFATSINPPDNDLASNPLEIFAQLERVVSRGQQAKDFEKVQSLLGRLRSWILMTSSFDSHGAGRALMLIREAEDGRIELLQPIMWELRGIWPDRHFDGDEYSVENQSWRAHRVKASYELSPATFPETDDERS